MQSITQFASVTFKTNAPSAKLSKKSTCASARLPPCQLPGLWIPTTKTMSSPLETHLLSFRKRRRCKRTT